MRALIVYESVFGNTHRVAEAIARGLGRWPDAEVSVAPVDEVGPEDLADLDLLVVGGPTHVHGLARRATRHGGVEQEHERAAAEARPEHEIDPQAYGEPLRAWLDALGPAPGEAQAAAFDTRFDGPRLLTGSAGHGISTHLRHAGWPLLADHGSFLVDKHNDLLEGELERAEAWGWDLNGPVS